jgi:RimJ/RimL family protein N-acetyltransferase
MHVFVETERLVLRRFTMNDADLLWELDNDPVVMRYVPDLPPSREEVVEDMLPAFLSYYERFDNFGFWAAIEKKSGRFLGWFHFRAGVGAPVSEPELGYRLHRFAWNQGYATEGSRALIDKGFIDAGIERVTASAMAVNVGSCRVLEKVGLRLARTSHGDVDYAIDRSQWKADHDASR